MLLTWLVDPKLGVSTILFSGSINLMEWLTEHRETLMISSLLIKDIIEDKMNNQLGEINKVR
jgi:hypothetical protein